MLTLIILELEGFVIVDVDDDNLTVEENKFEIWMAMFETLRSIGWTTNIFTLYLKA